MRCVLGSNTLPAFHSLLRVPAMGGIAGRAAGRAAPADASLHASAMRAGQAALATCHVTPCSMMHACTAAPHLEDDAVLVVFQHVLQQRSVRHAPMRRGTALRLQAFVRCYLHCDAAAAQRRGQRPYQGADGFVCQAHVAWLALNSVCELGRRRDWDEHLLCRLFGGSRFKARSCILMLL